MTYQYGSPNWYPAQSPAAYGASTSAADQRGSRANPLIWIVLALGLATYLVGYAAALPPGDTGWSVRFAAAAAVVAALGLFPRQRAQTKVVVTLAVMGLLDALSQLFIGAQNSSWALIVIVVLNALQAATAIAALVTQLRVPAPDNRGLTRSDAYAYYGHAAQQYYGANSQQPQQQPAQSQATAQADAAATAQAQESAAQRYALYSEYLSTQQSPPNRVASSPQLSGYTQAFQPASGADMPRTGAAESIRSTTETATESPAPPGS